MNDHDKLVRALLVERFGPRPRRRPTPASSRTEVADTIGSSAPTEPAENGRNAKQARWRQA